MLKKQFLISLIAVFVTILSACGNTSEETNQKPSDMNQAQEEPDNTSDDETDADGMKKPADNEEAGEPNGPDEDEGEVDATEDLEQQKSASKKQEYLKKLEAAKKKADTLISSDRNTPTVVLKKEAEDRWQVWDSLLNDIYGDLKNQLPAEEMKDLQTEQRNWLVHRDGMALKASEKYKGGTAEQLEYVMVLADQTEQRCYELVNTYMR